MPQWNAKPSAGAQAEVDALEQVVATLSTTVSANSGTLTTLSNAVNDGMTGLATKASTTALTSGLAGKAALVHAAQHQLGGTDRVRMTEIGSRLDYIKMSNALVEAFPRHFCHGAQPLVTSRVMGPRTRVLVSGTATTISLFQNAAGTPTSLYMCVYGADNALLRITSNLVASMGAGLLVSGTLLNPTTLLPEPLTLVEGDLVFPCAGGVHTGVTVGGIAEPSILQNFAPSVSVISAAGAFPPVGPLVDSMSGSKTYVPWIIVS